VVNASDAPVQAISRLTDPPCQVVDAVRIEPGATGKPAAVRGGTVLVVSDQGDPMNNWLIVGRSDVVIQ